MMMAGFMSWPVSTSAAFAASEMLEGYDKNYKLGGSEGALYLFWKRRPMATCSAWKPNPNQIVQVTEWMKKKKEEHNKHTSVTVNF